ncbi:methyl-accepting chemotaxis protein [Streptohalobacillus salinus]|uniref:Methyl-accepting chemotaxis protein n=1 Tax=Streptohalobacillus salinus TaxID=621096 RepID=A0A2V3WFA5_9BACI|nr:methyl-accepting chemotaxis protein [Streptohalobacillus salinus]PXW92945.1 methyl-accepting chemotaxis protein [Streptohalobacillus salinus]
MRKFKQIKFLLPFFMIILLVVPLGVTSFISYSNTAIIERAIIEKEELEALGSAYEETFTEYEAKVNDYRTRDVFDYTRVDPSGTEAIDSSQLPAGNTDELTGFYQETLADIAEDDPFILNLYLGTEDRALYLHSIPDVDLTGYDPTTTEWYSLATEANDTIWTAPYIDTATGRPVITVASPINDEAGNTIGVVGLDFDMAELAGMVRSDILIQNLITAAIAIIIGLLVVFYLVKNISTNLAHIRTEMNEVANGHLSPNDVEVKGDNEFKDLADSVNQMKTQLRQMIDRVKQATKDVANQSDTLSMASSQVKEGSEQIAATMEELSSGSESQANSASDLAVTMEKFNQYVKTATTHANDVEGGSSDVTQLSEAGAVKVSTSVKQMTTIDQIVKDAFEKVQGLDKKANEVGSIVQVIQEIAEQTNLLALNAAIEAARAGEEGRGFAVVADEVRKLAEQVGASVSDITGIITDIQNESKTVAESLSSGYKAVEDGSSQIKETGEAFDTIKQAIGQMVDNINKVVNDLNQIETETGEMQKAIDDIAAVSEESAAAVEETAASAEETNSSMEEVSNSSDQLRHLSNDLENEVSRFKL